GLDLLADASENSVLLALDEGSVGSLDGEDGGTLGQQKERLWRARVGHDGGVLVQAPVLVLTIIAGLHVDDLIHSPATLDLRLARRLQSDEPVLVLQQQQRPVDYPHVELLLLRGRTVADPHELSRLPAVHVLAVRRPYGDRAVPVPVDLEQGVFV
ncbi:hypothetical protein EGW08_019952, partial [Elysia chlorotica]